MEKYFRDDQGADKPWLFPQILNIARSWLKECVLLKDNTFPQLFLLMEFAHDGADRIYQAIVASSEGDKSLKPILKPYDTLGSTRYVDFDTIRPVYATRPDKCHISHVVADTESWEQKMASALEDMDEIIRYVKNQNLGFAIPYTINGEERNYYPDFIARIKSPCPLQGDNTISLSPLKGMSANLNPPLKKGGRGDFSEEQGTLGKDRGEVEINLIIEVTGENKKDKAAKVSTAKTLWVPAINNHGGFGRWGFFEIKDPWNAMNEIGLFLRTL